MLIPRASVPDIEVEDLSAYTEEVEQNADGKSVLTRRALIAQQQEFREWIKQYPPMQQLPAKLDAEITHTGALLSFGLGITYEHLLAYAAKRNIRASWAPDEAITSPAVAWVRIARLFMERMPGFLVYYRRPFSVHYEGLLALYSNHSMRELQRRGEAHEKMVIEFLQKEMELDSTPMWYWDMDYTSYY
ncbi:hypothetical protein HETIRDRAFT_328315 [Heterobasidion irregulare TC 32-1]|uniref:Uncharacterized protein n=1 Tax=Heterobasidion irregulare (strain TC 32-1) TaxID=747525 RepID=W4JSS2_HETIT|nr:uncharacterized protein HETIRDRAFT_328315 [Heterobasidion irregulare TC 32-1]ETW76588.1 hypothetical protein HETIRDRAFT_328315 [Heterobasidion irregulare TC 32-1]